MRLLSGLLILLICGPLVALAARGDDLEALCNNDTIPLGRISQFESIYSQVEDGSAVDCHTNTEAAIRDFKRVIEDNKYNECSMESYNRYRKFYKIYLDTSDADKMETFVELPFSLREFTIGYGMQLSGLCRAQMVYKLLDEGSELVTPEDFEMVKDLIAPDGPMAAAIGYTGSKPDENVLPGDLLLLEKRYDKDSKENKKDTGKIGLKIRTVPYVKLVQTLCERRFKPIYGPLIMPVTQFANLGFNLRKGVLKGALKKALKKEETRDIISRWSRVVFMCEIMDNIELVEDAEDRELSKGNDATQVRITSKDATTTTKNDDGKDESESHNLLEEIEVNLDDIKPIPYNPVLSVDIPNDILVTLKQKRAAKKVNTNLDEVANIKMRLFTKLVRMFVKDMTRYRHIKIIKHIFKEFKDQVKLMNESKEDKDKIQEVVSTNLVHSLNNVVDRSLNPDKGLAAGKSSGALLGWIMLFMVVAVALLMYYNLQVFWSTMFVGVPFPIG